jgi:diguanylate cyclase (GGDEF)-like protein
MLTVPPFFAAILSDNGQRLEAMMLALYSIYMVIQASRLNREYLKLIEQQFQLSQLNQQDGLTGIANRRCFDHTLVHFWKTHVRTQAQLSLMIIDIDHFKQVNDSYGHAAGDEVIIEVANILRARCKRETDLVARIGGEEFAVLIAINNFDTVQEIAEKIRRKVEKTTIEHDDHFINITISIGIAYTVPDLNKDTANFYKLADQCLYRAKENGRNRIESETYNS